MSNKKILFVTIPEKGHVNPMIGIAQHLQQAGYELAFFAQQDISEQLQKAGLHQKVYSDPSAINIHKGFVTRGKDFVEKLSDKVWLHNWIKTLLIDAAPEQANHIHAAAADFRPALIVTDPMVYAAPIVAHKLNIPWAGVSSSLNPVTPSSCRCALTDTLSDLESARTSLFTNVGIIPRFKVSDAISPWLNIVFSTEAYMPRAECGNNFSFYTGNSFPIHHRGDETDFPFERLIPQTKKIYVSFGSQIYYQPHLFEAIAKAFPDKHIQLIFSLNELYHSPFIKKLPDNVISVYYAPQLQLLKHVDLTITHGGANTVMESLAHGVPVAIFPICNDQFLQAQLVVRAGVGIELDPSQPISETYRQQLLPLLDPHSSLRSNAAKIAESFRQHGGAAEASQLIQQLHNTQKPMLP